MAILKSKEIAKMTAKEIEERIKELKMELVKERVSAAKGGKLKTKEIKRTIARLLTFNRPNKFIENFGRKLKFSKNHFENPKKDY